MLCDFFDGWLSSQILKQSLLSIVNLIDRLKFIDGDSDGSCLRINGASDTLSNPPRSIGRKFEPFCPIKLFYRLDQTKISQITIFEVLYLGY